jgi:predicted ATPase
MNGHRTRPYRRAGRRPGGIAPNRMFRTDVGLLGRSSEFELIREALAGARRGAGGLLLVCGEPGIGKSRLLSEAAAEAERAGMVVAWGRCREDGGAPAFLPWLQVLRAAGCERLSAWPEVAALLASESAPGPVPPSAQYRLLESFAGVIGEVGGSAGLLAVVDDLHRADRASLAVLEHLAADLNRLRVLVLAAYRDTAVPPGGQLAGELARVVAAAGGHVVALGGLDVVDVGTLIAAHAGPVESRVAATVAERTSGNPYFVIGVAVLLRGAADQAAVAAGALPPTVAALITDRVAVLPAQTRRALEAAAVLGRDFGRLPLAAVLELTEIATAAALQPAASSGLICPGPAGTYRFTHALVQSTVYGALTLARRRALHLSAATALERSGGDDDEKVSDLAYHSYCAAMDGDPGPALVHVLAAGRRAAQRLAFRRGGLLAWPRSGAGGTGVCRSGRAVRSGHGVGCGRT